VNVEQVISVVEKWIENPEAVSKKELKAAYEVYAHAALYTARAASFAASSAMYGHTDGAKHWVAEYHKSIND